jgi:hypothetical protein
MLLFVGASYDKSILAEDESMGLVAEMQLC